MKNKHLHFGCLLSLFVTLWLMQACQSNDAEKIFNSWQEHPVYAYLKIIYPFDSSLFPSDFACPRFIWEEDSVKSVSWIISFYDKNQHYCFSSGTKKWKPERGFWERIKKEFKGKYLKICIIGVDDKNNITSAAQINIGISPDPVGAPVFYRDIPLPFAFARAHVDSIKWRLQDVSSDELAPVVMENLPVCANCHSFSPNGKYFGMDVDALGIKSAYITADVKEEIDFSPEKFNYWSDFQNGEFTYGLLSQVSPDGRFVVSTLKDHEIFVPKPDLYYSNFFFPIRGILVVYDRQTKKYWALPGADNPDFIQSNPSWSPDGKYIYFTRGTAVSPEESGILRGTAIADSVKFNDFLNRCFEYKRLVVFDLYKIPFNDGKGGKAEPVKGASENGMSNYFAKVSPDGKWLIFNKAKSFMLLQPDSRLYIMPVEGGWVRELECNTNQMNSWHSWSPDGKWIVFSSKVLGPYTRLFLSHIDENGHASKPVMIENLVPDKRAVNIPEFVNIPPGQKMKMNDKFSKEGDYNLIVRAYWLRLRGDYDASLQTLNFAMKKTPSDPEIFYQRGLTYIKLNRLEEALKDLDSSIVLNPENASAWGERGHVRLMMKDFKAAVKDLEKSVAIYQKSPQAYYNLAYAHSKLGNKNAAIRYYTNALSLNPGYIEALMNRGVERIEIKDYQGAIADFSAYIRLKPDDPLIYVLRANAYDESGNYSQALTDYDKAISLKRNFLPAYLNKAIAHYRQNDFNQAWNNIIQAWQLDSQHPEVLYWKGMISIAMGKKTEGYNDLKASAAKGFQPARAEVEKYSR